MTLLLLLLTLLARAEGPPPVPRPGTVATSGDTAAFLHQAAAPLDPALTAWRQGPESEDYHFAAEAFADIAAAMQRWPGRVRAERIGTSVKDRPLWAFRVRDPTFPVQHKLLVFANIHAMEWISTEVALAFLLDAIERPPPGVELAVIPVLNPDGRARVEADLLEGDHASYHRTNGNRVDLNRDFASNRQARAAWKAVIPGYYATSPAALSQPESRAIDAIATEGWDAAVSLHAFGGYHFLPWAGRWERPDDRRALLALGRTMQTGQGAGAYKVMQLSRYMFFFRGHGMEIDHLYGQHGIPSVLVELTRSGITGPRDLKTPFRWYNPRKPARHVDLGAGALHAVAWQLAWSARTGDPVPWLP